MCYDRSSILCRSTEPGAAYDLTALNQLWVADITSFGCAMSYIWQWFGCYSRRVTAGSCRGTRDWQSRQMALSGRESGRTHITPIAATICVSEYTELLEKGEIQIV